jgi:hypothetical protein
LMRAQVKSGVPDISGRLQVAIGQSETKQNK